MRRCLTAFLSLALLCAAAAAPAVGDDSCIGFKWDVRKERALFAGAAVTPPAANKRHPRVSLSEDTLYELKLLPQSKVKFPVAPGKQTAAAGAYAGLAAVDIKAPGVYRVAADLPVWLDVAAGDALAKVTDYQGQHGCDAPRKIVEFDLTGAKRYVLQVSGAPRSTVRVTITRAPPAT